MSKIKPKLRYWPFFYKNQLFETKNSIVCNNKNIESYYVRGTVLSDFHADSIKPSKPTEIGTVIIICVSRYGSEKHITHLK